LHDRSRIVVTLVDIGPLDRPPDATVTVPGAAAITHNALAAAALARGRSCLSNAPLTDDTLAVIDVLRTLGVPVEIDASAGRVIVHGVGGHLPADEADVHCSDSASALCFATALCALGRGRYRVDGNDQVRAGRIDTLTDALETLGAQVQYEADAGHAPVALLGRGLGGGEVSLSAPVCPDLISALLLVAPCARSDVFVAVRGEVVGPPPARITGAVMDAFGVGVIDEKGRRLIVPAPQVYQPCDFRVEPDAAMAAFFFSVAAVTGGRVTVEGLGADALQSEVRFVDLLEQMGCAVDRQPSQLTVNGPRKGTRLHGIDADLHDMPHMAPMLAVVALFADGPTRIRNARPRREEQTASLDDLTTALRRFGAEAEVDSDAIAITPPDRIAPASVNAHDDPHLAMSFVLPGLAAEGVTVEGVDSVSRAYPEFIERLEELRRSASA